MKAARFCSVLLLCLCLTWSRPFSALAAPLFDVQTSSDALSSASFESSVSLNSDIGIAPASSMGTVSNTISSAAKVSCQVFYHDDEGRSYDYHTYATYRSGRWHFSTLADGIIYQINFVLRPDGLPSPGSYTMGFDFASDFSYDYSSLALRANQYSNNVAANSPTVSLSSSDWSQYSGDLYIPSYSVNLGNLDGFWIRCGIPSSQNLTQVGGSFAFSFSRSSDTPSSSIGYDTSTQDFQNSVSTTTNAIYDTLQELIQHISNQLAALWDQMYNLMHVPTMAKLNEILSALRAIANNSDISAVVDQIDESNKEQIANDNVNTAKVEQAVEKHGNFIIDGLKGLFIPSDDYFSSTFSDLNDFFADRFGFLYTPIDILIRFINLLNNADADFSGIPFPELKWGDQVLVEAQTVGFDILENDTFAELQQTLYFLTDLIMVGALLVLIHKKFEEVMQN